ncbi:TPA: hypothetical protein ACNVQT_004315 [Citrobacter farmeri]
MGKAEALRKMVLRNLILYQKQGVTAQPPVLAARGLRPILVGQLLTVVVPGVTGLFIFFGEVKNELGTN